MSYIALYDIWLGFDEWSSPRWKLWLRNSRKSGKGSSRSDDIYLEGDSIRVQRLVTICGQSRDIVTLVTNISNSWPRQTQFCFRFLSRPRPGAGDHTGGGARCWRCKGLKSLWQETIKQSNFTSYHKSVKGINGWHCLVPCCALSLEAEQVIIGKERNIGDGRCPELGAGRGRGSSACWWPCSSAPTICNPIRPEPELSPASTGWWSHVEQSEQWPCWRHSWLLLRPRHAPATWLSAVASVHSVNSTHYYLDSGFRYRKSHMISEASQCKKSEQYLYPSLLCSK